MDDEYFRSNFESGFEHGYQEGFLLGKLESAVNIVESGYLSIQEVAELFEMSELEFRMKVGLGFPEDERPVEAQTTVETQLMDTMSGLVRDGLLTLPVAAGRINITPEEFSKRTGLPIC